MQKSDKGIRFALINFIRVLLVLAFLGSLYKNRNLVMIFSILGFFITFLPRILKELFGFEFPAIYEILIIAFIYGILFLGDVRGVFFEFWWWDILLNFIASIALGVLGFTVLFALYKDKRIRANPFIILVLTFSFTLAIGTVWEVIEFALDSFFGFTLQKSALDIMKDLAVNMLGALLVSIFGYSYMKNGKIKIVSGFIMKQIEKNPRLFGQRNTLEESSTEMLNLISKGEGTRLEFKSTLRTNLHTLEIDNRIEHGNMKSIVAFLNTNGGTLLIGVDNSGKVQGLERDKFKDNDALSLHFTNLLKTYIGSEFLPFINFELYPFEDRHVLKIDCLTSKKPVFLKSEKEEEFYIRNGPSSVKLSGRQLLDYIDHHFIKE